MPANTTRKRRASRSRSALPADAPSPRRSSTSQLIHRLRSLPRLPLLLPLLLMITLILLQTRPRVTALRQELSLPAQTKLTPADLLKHTPLPLSTLSTLRPTHAASHILSTTLTLQDNAPLPATLHLRLPPRPFTAQTTTAVPSFRCLANFLTFQNLTSPLVHPFHLPLPPPPSLCSRSLARKLSRLAGFRSTTTVPHGTFVEGTLIQSPAKPVPMLRKPAPEPYDWESSVPTAPSCARAKTQSMQRDCRDLVQILLIVYISGCAPLAEGELLRDSFGNLQVGVPAKCFERSGTHWYVSKDILVAYLSHICELPRGLFARLRALEGLAWGVSERALELRRIVEEGAIDGKMICEGRWSFYDDPRVGG